MYRFTRAKGLYISNYSRRKIVYLPSGEQDIKTDLCILHADVIMGYITGFLSQSKKKHFHLLLFRHEILQAYKWIFKINKSKWSL